MTLAPLVNKCATALLQYTVLLMIFSKREDGCVFKSPLYIERRTVPLL